MHQAFVFMRRLTFQERRKILENESGCGRIHGAGDLRKSDQAVISCDFEQADSGAQWLLEQRGSDGDILQLDDFDIGDLHWGPRLLILDGSNARLRKTFPAARAFAQTTLTV